jgi:excisionase family DNA binding protein
MRDAVLLTVPQVAELLSLSRSKVYELLASGALESVTIGRARRVPHAALETFVAGLRECPGFT